MTRRLKPVPFTWGILVVLAMSAGINVLQAQRIRSLIDGGTETPATIGRLAQPIVGFGLDGTAREIALTGAIPTVVYFFSATCGWCERNWSNIEALRRQAAGRYRVVGVARSRNLRAYVETRRLGIDVIEGISDNTQKTFGFSGTPQTVVISAEGLITHEWRGAYTGRIARQIEELFGFDLPGVTQSQTSEKSKTSK